MLADRQLYTEEGNPEAYLVSGVGLGGIFEI